MSGSKSIGLIQLLKSRGFINQQLLSTEVGEKCLINSYGPPGTVLKHNIKRQWWKHMVQLQRNVFPIEATNGSMFRPISSPNAFTNESKKNNSDVVNSCLHKYAEVLTLSNGRLPFSVACINERVQPQPLHYEGAEQTEENSFFFGSVLNTEMVLQNYVQPSGVSRVFDFWLQSRLSWWKRYLKQPSKLKVSSLSSSSVKNCDTEEQESESPNGKQNGQHVSIEYEFPWGPESLEVVSNEGDKQLVSLQAQGEDVNLMAKLSASKSVLPHCVQCVANLEVGMAAVLTDCFQQRQSLKPSKTSQILPVIQLHPHLCPFHVALVITSSTSSTTKELGYICRQLEQDLLQAGVSVFNASEHVGTLNAHFKRNDQLAIPYTLIFNENTLKDGIISSRDRDTEIKKQIHVTRAVEEVSRNVKAVLE